MAVMSSVAMTDPPGCTVCGGELADLLRQMMDRDPARRPSFPSRQEESWSERLLDILRRILVPGGQPHSYRVRAITQARLTSIILVRRCASKARRS